MIQKNFEDREYLRGTITDLLNRNISKQELVNLIQEVMPEELPLELFRLEKLSNLEAIVKYLRENQNLSYKEIGEKLCRNPLTLAVVYSNAKQKMPELISISCIESVPYSVFNNGLSIMECVVLHLKNQGLKQIQISKILKKDPRTIWTIIKRAEVKCLEKERKILA